MTDKDEAAIFDRAWYLSEYPDVAQIGMDPLEHYQWIGRRMGRKPCEPTGQAVTSSPSTAASKAQTGKLEDFYRLDTQDASAPQPSLSPLMRYIWNSRPDLQDAFDLKTCAGREAYVGWFNHSLPTEYKLPLSPPTPKSGLSSDGVNLIGYACSPSGMGEHVRMVAHSIAANNRPFGLLDVGSGVGTDQSVKHWISNKQPYRTNIFHVNADMFTPEVLRLGSGHYNIGYWAWELAQCPASFDPALQLADEIWGISEFVSEAFRARTNVPVYTLPLAVKVPDLAPAERSKARFGLDEDTFTFLFTFDAASYLDRKNPVDTVRAFQRAFPDRGARVRLVLKTHGVERAMGQARAHFLWTQLLNEIGEDPRILIINRSMTRDEVFALSAACDAFVSLHRSEGFGRNLAEAMIYGRPVIATGYSGSNEFIRANSAIPIDYHLIPLGEGAYPHGEGQVWAQPDIDQAARAMRRLVEDPAWCQQIGRAGQALIRNDFNEKVIGERYIRRLDALNSSTQMQVPASLPVGRGASDAVTRLRRHIEGKQTALFTIVSCNYMAFARTVLQSVRAQHPEFALCICLVDEGEGLQFPESDDFLLVRARELALPNFLDMRVRYDVMELNTAVKPFFIDWIYENTGVDKAIYFDPDLFLYCPLDDVLGALDAGHSAVLTPHINHPIKDDGCLPDDHSMLEAGVFNLGFIATRRTDETRRFIRWWATQLETAAIADIRNNLFTDQRWCDLAPCFLHRLKVLHHSGHNVAYWNLDQRKVERAQDGSVTVNNDPLVFFHYSGFHPRKVKDVSKHQTRFTWDNISPTTRELMTHYAERLLDNGYETATSTPYAYNKIDGLTIQPVMRYLYRTVYPRPRFLSSEREARRELLRLCAEPVDAVPADGGELFTRLAMQVYALRPDVQAAFPLGSAQGAAGFRGWYEHSIGAEYSIDLKALECEGTQ